MKVFLYYEDNDHKMLHKTLKITLPKSWKNGPTSKLLHQFVETYNASDLSKSLTLNADEMHLAHNKGCMTGRCTDVKDDEEGKQFLGGCDLRDALHGESEPLKSIDDFNKAQADGSDAAPVLQRLRGVMKEIGVENELFDQVFEGIRNEAGAGDSTEEDELVAATSELGKKLKAAMKKIAVDQLRIK
eukprot:919367_1